QRLLDQPLVHFIAEEERQAFGDLLLQLQQLKGIQEWEVRLQPWLEATFPVALTVTAIGHAQSLVGLRWLLRDISERKQIEEALRQAQKTLEHRVEERTVELQRMNAQLQIEIVERQQAAAQAQQAEQALRSSREQLRQLATHL